MTAGEEFETIIEEARSGAEWAWTAVYRSLSPMVLRYLRAHQAIEPEDVLGEVFLQIVRKLADFKGGEREFRAWVFRIARNRLIDEWRHRNHRPIDMGIDEVIADTTPAGNSEDDAMQKLSQENVRLILEQLSPDQRDVLFLRLFGGLTILEIAGVLNKTPGAVKSLQVRGLARISREISKGAVSL